MAHATYEEVLTLAQELTAEEQDQLIEELADIRAYDAAKARLAAGEDEAIPLDQAIAESRAQRAKRDAA